MFNSTFKRKKSALKISIVKFSFYFVCGININWFSTNAFFFRLFYTIFLDCMQPIVCFWSVNDSFLIFISIICIIKYSWLKVVTIPLNFKQLVYHSEQPNRKSIVTADLEKDESFT